MTRRLKTRERLYDDEEEAERAGMGNNGKTKQETKTETNILLTKSFDDLSFYHLYFSLSFSWNKLVFILYT